MNELLFFVSIVLVFSGLMIIYRYFGKTGIYSWIVFASVIANIIVVKTVNCFGMTTTLGNVLFGSVFLATDILSENFNKKEANNAVILGLLANIAFIFISLFVLIYRPDASDFADQGFRVIFKLTPRVCLGSIAAYAFGNFLDIAIFDKLKNRQGKEKLWLRNNVSTIIAQLLDNFILHIIAFLGVMNLKEVVILSLNVWIIEIIIALCDTPFVYYSRKIIPKTE